MRRAFAAPECPEAIARFWLRPRRRAWNVLAGLSMLTGLLLSSSVCVWGQTQTLPPLRPPDQPGGQLSEQLRVRVKEFQFRGNTVFSDAELAQVLTNYVNRSITSTELQEARRAVTLHYVSHGYINSGALLEDQPVEQGIITFVIVEGKLSEIEISGNRRLRSSYLRPRIELGAGPPLDMKALNERLLMLKDNPNIKRINAELRPGAVRGTSLLDVHVVEASPWSLGLLARNDRPPSVGAESLELLGAHRNLTGHSDTLGFHYGIVQRTQDGAEFSGLDNVGGSYALPVTAYDTMFGAYYNRNDYAILEEPFDALDITSESISYGLSLRHPLYRSTTREVSLSLAAERRQSRTFLKGDRFSVAPGAVDGESTVSVLRLAVEWVERKQSQVIALRSTLSVGIDVLDATDDGTDRDGQFLSWQGQAQYVRRLWNTPNELILSLSGQWANDPLLSLEQFSIGGLNTVRGYRENQVVRDAGLVGSAEFHLPVFFGKAGNPLVQLAPFVDYGAGWNIKGPTPEPISIASAGIGLLLNPTKNVSARIYWGYPFRDFENGKDDLQDYGLHFKITAFLF